MPLSLYAFVGIIMLVGIVKKNAIMMIDFALEGQRTRTARRPSAIYEALSDPFPADHDDDHGGAGRARLPIALGVGAGAEARRPLGLAVVGGLDPVAGSDALYNAGDLSSISTGSAINGRNGGMLPRMESKRLRRPSPGLTTGGRRNNPGKRDRQGPGRFAAGQASFGQALSTGAFSTVSGPTMPPGHSTTSGSPCRAK